MEASNQELIAERDAVAPSLGIKKATIKDSYNKWKETFDKTGKLPVSVVCEIVCCAPF